MNSKQNLALGLVNYIRTNRVSTTEFADAMGKKGSLVGVAPLTPNLFKVGIIRHIQVIGGSNYELHKQLEESLPEEVIFVEPIDFGPEAVFGDLVARFSLLYKSHSAIVVSGNVRDVNRLRKEGYPIWAVGSNPVGAINSKVDSQHLPETSLSGGIAVCDDGGVVICPPELVTEELFTAVKFIELQEDIWYYCLNTLKWSTFDIVCKKRYLTEIDELPNHFRKALEINPNE